MYVNSFIKRKNTYYTHRNNLNCLGRNKLIASITIKIKERESQKITITKRNYSK